MDAQLRFELGVDRALQKISQSASKKSVRLSTQVMGMAFILTASKEFAHILPDGTRYQMNATREALYEGTTLFTIKEKARGREFSDLETVMESFLEETLADPLFKINKPRSWR